MKPRKTEDFFDAVEEVQRRRGKERSTLLDEIVSEVVDNANFLKDQARKYKEMHEKYLWLIKYRHILTKARAVQAKNRVDASAMEELKGADETLLSRRVSDWRMRIDTIAGVISTEDCVRFERLIFRITRGTPFLP